MSQKLIDDLHIRVKKIRKRPVFDLVLAFLCNLPLDAPARCVVKCLPGHKAVEHTRNRRAPVIYFHLLCIPSFQRGPPDIDFLRFIFSFKQKIDPCKIRRLHHAFQQSDLMLFSLIVSDPAWYRVLVLAQLHDRLKILRTRKADDTVRRILTHFFLCFHDLGSCSLCRFFCRL